MPLRRWFRAALKLPCLPVQSPGRHKGGPAVWRPARSPPPRIAMRFGEEEGGLDIWSDLAKVAFPDGSQSRRRNGCDTRLVSPATRGASTYVSAAQEVAAAEPATVRATFLPRARQSAAPEARQASGALSTPQGESPARPRSRKRVRFAPDVATGPHELVERPVPSVEASATPAWPKFQPGRALRRASGSRGVRLPPTIHESPLAAPSALRGIPPGPAIAWEQIAASPIGGPGRPAAALNPVSRPQSRTAARTQLLRQHQHGGANSTPPAGDEWEEPPLNEMSRESVFAVVNAVGRLIPHLPLAVCGRAALVYYGHPDHRPSHVSVVCPEHAAALLVGWARTTGLRPSAHFPRAFYVVAPHPGGAAIGCVRVLACRDFERLGRVRPGPSATPVLALPHMADRMAGRFCDALAAGGDEAAPRVSDILWTLRRIVEVGGDGQRLTLDSAPDFCCAAFLDPFTRRCPEAVSLLREAGLTLRSLPGPQLVASARSPTEAGSPCMGRDAAEQADEAQLPGTVREPSPASTVRARAIIASPHGRSASAQL